MLTIAIINGYGKYQGLFEELKQIIYDYNHLFIWFIDPLLCILHILKLTHITPVCCL